MRGTLDSKVWTWTGRTDTPPRLRTSCRYDTFVPHALGLDEFQLGSLTAATVAEAERLVTRMDTRADASVDSLARLLLRTEAIASSRIEGMRAGARELARAEAKHELGHKVGAEALAIVLGIDAMQRAVDIAVDAPAITIALLEELHGILMAQAAPWTTPGRIRTVQNWIGGNDFNPCGAEFVPPPPEHVTALLEDLCAFASADVLPPLMQAAIAHAQFETIHPFNDGNGRTGRALIHVIMRRRGLVERFVSPVSVVLARRPDRYVNGLTEFREGRTDKWVEQFSAAAGHAAQLATRYLAEVDALKASWAFKLATSADPPRADSAAWKLLEWLPSQPALTSPAAVALVGASRPRINIAIEQLVAAEVLQPLTTGLRNRVWEPVGLIEIIEALEQG